jgi:Ni/Co efflux regulator RcnB
MKNLMLAIAFFSFVGLTYANPCEDGKKCDKKECTHKKGDAKKECSSKDAKKACCSKDKATTETKASCHGGDKTASTGKACCASKAKTEEKKAE